MPIAITPKSETWRPTFKRFCTVRKVEVVSVRREQIINKAKRMPVSLAAKKPLSRRLKPKVPEMGLVVAWTMKIRRLTRQLLSRQFLRSLDHAVSPLGDRRFA